MASGGWGLAGRERVPDCGALRRDGVGCDGWVRELELEQGGNQGLRTEGQSGCGLTARGGGVY